MKSLKSVLTSVCLLLLFVSCVCAEQIDWAIASLDRVAQPPDSIALEYKFPEDQARKYDVTLAGVGVMKLPGQEIESKLETNTELTFVEQILGKGTLDGTWRVSRKLVKGVMTLPDFGTLPISAPTLEIEMDKYGAVRNIKGLDQLSSTFGLPGDKGMADILSQLKSIGFPKKALKVNDTWDEHYTVQLAGQQAVTVNVTSTLVGFDRVLKADCATIVTKYEAPFVFLLDAKDEKKPADAKTVDVAAAAQKPRVLAGTEKGEFRTYFSYGDGKIVQCHGAIELTADLDTGKKATDEKTASAAPALSSASEVKSTAATPAAVTAPNETPKHDLDVKYYVTSILNTTSATDATQGVEGRPQ